MSLPPWVIVETKPSAEEIAERSLRQAGYRVYLPRFRRLLSPHGGERKPAPSMRPLFQRLLFAQDWRGWPALPVIGTIGLMQMRPSVPAKISDGDIMLIMERERSGEFDEIKQANTVVAIDLGEPIEIDAYGTRVLGVLEELSTEGKVIISAMLFGRMIRTQVDAHLIRRAAGA